MKLTISTGQSREDKSWKNQEVTWEKLCTKLGKPVVTSESYAEYMALKGDQQMVIKDVGGFVGGTIAGGRRVKGSCTARSVITLDIDQCESDIIEVIQMIYGNAMLIHSTHKHSTLTPRYRIVIPLSREVHTDEYEAIARKVAGNIGIETFDPTTFQPERLMFWPSVSKDMVNSFECVIQKGEWLDADKVLDEYEDWTDMGSWPVSAKQKQTESKHRGKQENPAEKSGLIGVFCRAYGIEEAINKFLPHVYKKADGYDDRFTFIHGSTGAGVIVYDDMFSFSHHSTDPTMNRLCNSFDLVRIHLFGQLDTDDKIPSNKRPSFLKMADLISKDGLVKKVGLSEQLRAVNNAFEEQDLSWTELLETDRKQNILPTVDNMIIILENDEALKNCLSYDDFDKRQILQRSLPWREVRGTFGNELTDADEASYRHYFEKNFKISNSNKLSDALEIVIRKHTFHPVRDYLGGLKWDGQHRLDTLLIDVLGAEDDAYTRAVTRKTFVAAVKRVYEPGCKFDTCLTLIGAQGLGKSRLINSMGRKWYSDTFGNITSNAAMENIQGVWLMEVGEMAGFRRAEVEAVKLFVAKQEDRFRVAYGKRTEAFPRQCIFLVTTNEETPLHDQSGGRRFWLVKCWKEMGDNLESWLVDQLWAEACHFYKLGETVFLQDEVAATAKLIQEHHTETDDRMDAIIKYLSILTPLSWPSMSPADRTLFMAGDIGDYGEGKFNIDRVSVEDIWIDVFRGTLKDMTPFNTKFIRQIMNRLPGWEPNFYTFKGKSRRGWVRTGGIFDSKTAIAAN